MTRTLTVGAGATGGVLGARLITAGQNVTFLVRERRAAQLARLANDSRTRAYAAKKRAEGKTAKDVLRCLKRAISREVYRHLISPCPVPDNGDLRPLRQATGHTLTEVARHFGAWPARISDIERGKRRDDDFAQTYREWLLASPSVSGSGGTPGHKLH